MTISGEATADDGFDKARKIIEKLLVEELQGKDFEIKEFFAMADDEGGDGSLYVVVVYDPSVWQPDARELPGFTVNLRTALWNEGERRYPVMSYARADEYEEAVAAP